MVFCLNVTFPKDYVFSQITDCQNNAEWEKQRRFIENTRY